MDAMIEENTQDYQQKQLEEERLAYQLFLLAWVDERCSRVTSEALASELGIRDEFLKHIGAK